MIASDDVDIEAIASEFDSDAMASISRRFDAMIASDDLDIEAIASESNLEGRCVSNFQAVAHQI
jgi:hypothetical protein